MKNVTRNWCLRQIIHNIKDHLEKLKTIEFNLVKRSISASVDTVVKKKVERTSVLIEITSEEMVEAKMKLDF